MKQSRVRITIRFFICVFALFCVNYLAISEAQEGSSADSSPRRLTRSESFFGVHFDFHAGANNQGIGANTTPEMIQEIIDRLHPDFIQIDCKGHPGFSSYETKVGNKAPGVVTDSLKVWREVTAKNGVALYMHYSGVYDCEACAKHPEWAVVARNGQKSQQMTSVFKGYRTDLLVPQLKELALDYGVDGVWVDGECWATAIDYSEEAQTLFKKATGYEVVPQSPGEEHWLEWCDFHREAFREYLRSYVSELKEAAPLFQIASNWAFTDHMPEPISAPVAFISGDYSPNNSINAARYSARLMTNQGASWDLMAWSFGTKDGAWSQKPGFQLSREAACVLALGGAFQAYITQEADGSVNLDKLPAMEETAAFCRARQAFCEGSTGVPQVALFCPTAAHYRNVSSGGESLFPMITWQRPILQRLLENNYAVDVLTDEALSSRINEFPVVVFFRGDLWSDTLKKAVASYLANGGAVVALGSELSGELSPLIAEGALVKTSVFNGVKLESYEIGKGRLDYLSADTDSDEIRNAFNNAQGDSFVAALRQAMTETFARPIVEFDEPKPLDVSVRRDTDGNLNVHFVNVSGNHEAAGILDRIDPVENVKGRLNLPVRPSSLRLEPSGIDVPFEWKETERRVLFRIDSIPIHEILVVK